MNWGRVFLVTACCVLCMVVSAQKSGPSCGKRVRLSDFVSEHVLSRHVDVWLPPGYHHEHTYPVLYMNDGQNLFDPEEAFGNMEWGMDETLCRLIGEGRIPPVIVVGIWNTRERHSEYYPDQVYHQLPACSKSLISRDEPDNFSKGNDYLCFLTEELIPWMERYFRIKPDPSLTFIGGSSMGGLISLYAMCQYPEYFGGAMCLSTHWIGNFEQEEDECITESMVYYIRNNLPDPDHHTIYMDCGSATLDALYIDTQALINEAVCDRGYDDHNWVSLVFEGAEHHERDWASRLETPLEWLFRGMFQPLSVAPDCPDDVPGN